MTDDESAPDVEPNDDPNLKSLGWTEAQRNALGKITAVNASSAALRESFNESSRKLRQTLNFKPWEEVADRQREMRPLEFLNHYPEPTFDVLEPAENPLVKPVGELVQLNASLLEEQQRLRAEADERDQKATKLARAVFAVSALTLLASVVVPLLIWWLSE